MVDRPLQDISVPPPILHRLSERNFYTAKDVLSCNLVDLMELLDLSEAEAKLVMREVSLSIAPAFCTVLQLQQEQSRSISYLPTGLPGLDASLRGGFPVGGITELVGPAGVGKSQFCFGAALKTVLPHHCGGLGGNVVFIDTERKFSPHRMVEMARAQLPSEFAEWSSLQPVLDRILIFNPDTSEQLLRCLQGLETVLNSTSARLVVLDSVAALLRIEYSNAQIAASVVGGAAGGPLGSVIERQELLGQQAALLKLLAERFRVPVIVTNQVTARMGGGGTGDPGGELGAALGTKWAHCVNSRLVLERRETTRCIKVVKSPTSGPAIFAYSIGRAGVEQQHNVQPLGPGPQGNVLDVGISNQFQGGLGMHNY